MLTCKQFLDELNDFLDETLDPAEKANLQRHVSECPNCWVVCNTTEKTLKIYKGLDPQPLSQAMESRLMDALKRKWRDCGKHPKIL